MPDIEFRLTATDEATPVIERTRQKLEQFNKSYSAPMGGGGPRGGAPSSGPSRGPSGGTSGGMSGMLGKGMIGSLAGLTIIGQGISKILSKSYQMLSEASPYLKAVSQQFQTAMNIYLRPLGDSLARVLQPMSEYAIKTSEERSKIFESLDKQFGLAGTALGTFMFGLTDAYTALAKFHFGVLDALSRVLLWPIEQIGKMLGVDLPGSLTELLDKMFGIKGGFDGIFQWLENPPDIFGGLGEWIDRSIKDPIENGIDVLAGFGDWLYNGVKGLFSSAWSTIAGFGSWLYSNLQKSLSGIGTEAYKALHNALASMLNSIANIELPLVGKPFKGLIGTIPMLATGGIVTKPTMAFIGEKGPEAVVPLNRGMPGMGQGITIQINAPIYGVTDLESTINQAIARAQMGYSSYR